MNGKGDTPRPLSISAEEWERNWNQAFNNGETHAPATNEEPVPICCVCGGGKYGCYCVATDFQQTPEPSVEQAAHGGDSHSEDLHRLDMDGRWGRGEDHPVRPQRHGQDYVGVDDAQPDILGLG